MNDRGGTVLKTGKIGHVNILRQQMLMPGETVNTRIKGTVKLETLRERDALRIHAHMACFVTPLRWLWDEWPDYVKEGPTTTRTVPITQVNSLSLLGLGGDSGVNDYTPTWFFKAPERIYNEWYKHPEDPDINNWPDGVDGPPAVPLSHAWSRARYNTDPNDSGDYTLSSETEFDIRDLQALEGRFKSAMERDTLSYNRWMELMDMMYNADGSREVDKVPIMIDQTEVGVNPREMPATDGASLGQWQSIYDFNVDHEIRGIAHPEHCIVTYLLVVRFSSVAELKSPMTSSRMVWEERVGDPKMLEMMAPRNVRLDDVFSGGSSNSLGYLPAGWQWRSGFDVIDQRIDTRDTFPYMRQPTVKEEAKDATRINPAFQSEALGHYLADLYFTEDSRSLLNTSAESYYSGLQGGAKKDEHPFGGKML